MIPELSRRQKAGLAVALAMLLWAPLGISHGDSTMVTGHSTFYNGDTYDPCLGSIAGIMRNRVMWFNDQVLAESYGGKGTFIYVTEAGAPDPRDQPRVYSEGVFYDFVDPNGAHWHVEEAFYDVSLEPSTGFDESGTIPTVDPKPTKGDRYMTWFVELSSRPVFDEFAGDDPHTYYNFLVLADTCKMHNATSTYDGEEYHETAAELNDDNGHENGADPHQHGRFMVDLWVGKRPVTLPVGASTETVQWQSEWAAGGGAEQAAENQAEDVPAPPEDSLP